MLYLLCRFTIVHLGLQRVLHRRRQLAEQLLAVHHQPDDLGLPLELEHAQRRQTAPQLLQPLLRELPALLALPVRPSRFLGLPFLSERATTVCARRACKPVSKKTVLTG